MSRHDDFEQAHSQRYISAIKSARTEGMDSFMNWFNTANNVNQAIVRGHWDLSFHILTREVCKYISNPEDKRALEIGYGGGRILNAACSFFKEAIGVDIHEESAEVESFLNSQNKSNFKLIKTSGRTIDVPSGSVDFIYSFIVLQHLASFDMFRSYLKESYRCLGPGGVAQLYFGRFFISSVADLFCFFRGYKEIPDALTNHISLVVTVQRVKMECRKIGFKVIDSGISYKRVPDGWPGKEGQQSYVTLLKEK